MACVLSKFLRIHKRWFTVKDLAKGMGVTAKAGRNLIDWMEPGELRVDEFYDEQRNKVLRYAHSDHHDLLNHREERLQNAEGLALTALRGAEEPLIPTKFGISDRQLAKDVAARLVAAGKIVPIAFKRNNRHGATHYKLAPEDRADDRNTDESAEKSAQAPRAVVGPSTKASAPASTPMAAPATASTAPSKTVQQRTTTSTTPLKPPTTSTSPVGGTPEGPTELPPVPSIRTDLPSRLLPTDRPCSLKDASISPTATPVYPSSALASAQAVAKDERVVHEEDTEDAFDWDMRALENALRSVELNTTAPDCTLPLKPPDVYTAPVRLHEFSKKIYTTQAAKTFGIPYLRNCVVNMCEKATRSMSVGDEGFPRSWRREFPPQL